MTTNPKRLGLVTSADVALRPPDRGRLWYDDQIADQFLGGLPGIANKQRWVREHLPRAGRLRIGRHSAWYENDILAWLDGRRQSA